MMTSKIIRGVILLIAMAGSAYAAVMLKPQLLVVDGNGSGSSLENLIPKSFGGWVAEEDRPQTIVSADLKAELDKYYNEILSRTYVNPQGDRIMLSLAYGADQSKSLQVHKPEICYAAQGFKVVDKEDAYTATAVGNVPVTRLYATMGGRQEPITYWIRFGDEIVRNWFEQNRARILTGLNGHIPDGLLVRVSNIDGDRVHGYAAHDKFLKDLLAAVSPEGRKMLVGSASLQ